MRYWIACSVVTAIFAIGLFAVTEYFWIWSILLMGVYTGIGISFRIGFPENWPDEEKTADPALQTEKRVVE